MSSTTQLDANQVIKKVYDDTNGGLTVITSGTTTTVPLNVSATLWMDAVAAGASSNSTAIDVLAYKVVGVMATWTGLDHTDGSLKFQGSLDQTTWDDIGSPTTLSAAAGHQSFSLVDEPYQYIRLAYTHNANTTGSISAKYILRA